ncbi:MAG: DNA polymerase/3'-5' exonuclease PolX [Verrucomicrobiota bacterium]
MMTNDQVVKIFEETAILLEVKGENAFKCRAYSSAARTISMLDRDLHQMVEADQLSQVKGLGQALREKVSIMVREGHLPFYDKLRASLPTGIMDIIKIPGVGPKKVAALYQELGIGDVAALEAACQEGQLAKLTGFGKKTQEKILEGIRQIRSYANQHRYADVIERGRNLVENLQMHPAVARISLAGSLRRAKEVVKDVDIIASSKNPQVLMQAFVGLPEVEKIINQGQTKSSVLLEGGLQCDLRVVQDEQFPFALHHFTGSKEHNIVMRQRAIARGMKLSEWGLFIKKEKEHVEDELVPCMTEEALFKELDLAFIPPELREDRGEFEAAESGAIPRLLQWTELRGTFHNHTKASDGANTLHEMAEAAASVGLEYLGISDHSKSSVQANGLDEARLLQQVKNIQTWNKTNDDIHLFSGVECDILKDGSLDYEDDILSQLDYVVASVHQSMTLSEDDMTKRIIRALENPYVTILGHLTGRLLLRREAYALNIPKIIDAAAQTGTWIELNASPKRLDMDWRWWKLARDKGVKCVINPDAHQVAQLGNIRIGAEVARKGWLRKEDVVNTLKLSEIKDHLKV